MRWTYIHEYTHTYIHIHIHPEINHCFTGRSISREKYVFTHTYWFFSHSLIAHKKTEWKIPSFFLHSQTYISQGSGELQTQAKQKHIDNHPATYTIKTEVEENQLNKKK